jgi:hypothetical protein
MKIDLAKRKIILLACEEVYPYHLPIEKTQELMKIMGVDEFYGTLIYLHEKGQIHAEYEYSGEYKEYNLQVYSVRLTAEGLDNCFHMSK